MYTGLGDSLQRRADYVIGQVSLFRRWLRDAGVTAPPLDDTIAAPHLAEAIQYPPRVHEG